MEVAVSAKVVLGRDPIQAQIVFPSEDTAVSRRHCEISFNEATSQFEIRDLESRNGTFIVKDPGPPRRLVPDVVERVAPGQTVLVGSSRNRLVLELG
jgi:pSer/pThr/pTyr-binding forkhead associated (FHA) protein